MGTPSSELVITKIDSVQAGDLAAMKRMRLGKPRPLLISAVSGEGIKNLVHRMWDLIAEESSRTA